MKALHIVLLLVGMAAFFAVMVYTIMRALGLPIYGMNIAIMPMTFLLTSLPTALKTMRRKNPSGPP